MWEWLIGLIVIAVLLQCWVSSGNSPDWLTNREGLARKQLRETREIRQLEQQRLEQENERMRVELARFKDGKS